LRYCPVCDGYEQSGARIGCVGCVGCVSCVSCVGCVGCVGCDSDGAAEAVSILVRRRRPRAGLMANGAAMSGSNRLPHAGLGTPRGVTNF